MSIQSSSWEVAEESERYRVGNLIVEVGARRVLRNDEEIHLTELSFDLLVVLLRHAPAIAWYPVASARTAMAAAPMAIPACSPRLICLAARVAPLSPCRPFSSRQAIAPGYATVF